MKKVVQKIIVAGAVFHQGKVLIIQRGADEEAFPDFWELPGGKREIFENSQNALVREVKEETGLDVEPVRPLSVFEFKVEKTKEFRDFTQITFLCKLIGKSGVELSGEHQNYAWIKNDEIDRYSPMSDEIKNVLTNVFDFIK